MAEFTLKYFEDSDTISSADYNDNVDVINNGSRSVGNVNVRDQGLDVWNFKDETAIVDHYDFQVSVGKIQFLFTPNGNTRISSPQLMFKLQVLDLAVETDTTAVPVSKKTDELVAVFRCNFEYELGLLSTQDALGTEHSFLRVKVQFKLEATTPDGTLVSKWMPQMERTVTFYGKQLAMKRGYGNIGISSVLRKDDIAAIGKYTDFKLSPYFSAVQNPTNDTNGNSVGVQYFDLNSGYWDDPDAADDGYRLRLEIQNFISNLTLYRRAL